MRPAFALVCILSVTLTAGLGLAQPKAIRLRRNVPNRSYRPPPPKHPPQSAKEKACGQRRAMLDEAVSRQDDRRAELAGIGAEIVALQARLKQLEQRKNNLGVEISRAGRSLVTLRRAWESKCDKVGSCQQYEELTDTLETRQKPLVQYLERIRVEIAAIRQDLHSLRTQITPLRTDYQKLKCGNLVPGATSQTTINRCTAIFSEWNRVQTEVNRNNARLPALRSRHQRTAQQLEGTVKQAAEYETYLAKNCKASPKLEVVRRYKTVRDRARSLHAELDALAKDVTSLKSISITIR